MTPDNVLETDVLVVGGGMAGCFAAIKAREKGVDVTLVEKGYVSRSGQTPFATDLLVFNPAWGHDLDAWMAQVHRMGEYINHRDWSEITFRESWRVYQDLLSWGITFQRDEKDIPFRTRVPGGVTEFIMMEDRNWTKKLRQQALKCGVKMMERIMVAELLKQEGRIVGAVGIPMDQGDLQIFRTKAVILSVGASGLKPMGFPIANLTADGEAMAYRAGAEIGGKEFQDPHWTSAIHPGDRPRPPQGEPPGKKRPLAMKFINAEGEPLPERPKGSSLYPFAYMDLEFETHAGKAPIFRLGPDGTKSPVVGGASLGMSVRKAAGVWPADETCVSRVPGLYAAGDTLGNMQAGTVYSTMGSCLAGSAITGSRAAQAAAEYAVRTEMPVIADGELERAKNFVSGPMERKGGFSPQWVTQALQNIMMPYYVLYIKSGDRLEASLTLVGFIRDHLVPKLTAKDPHELRLANETRNMVLNAEMLLRSSLLRTESRGNHYREDYPARDDENWLAWVLLKEEEGRMKALKKPIPVAWRPDMSEPYEERYPYRFPGE